jgi:hypothetical protein
MHQARQRKVNITGVVSNASLVTGTPQVRDRARFVFAVLDQLCISGQLLRVTTSLGAYENMALLSYRVRRTHETRQMLVVQLTFEQKELVTSETVEVPDNILKAALRASGRGRKGKGGGAGQKENEKQKKARRRSASKAFYDWVRS